MTRTCADEDLNFFAGGGSDGVFSRGVFCRLIIFSFIPCEFYEIDIFQAGKKSEPPLDQHMYIIDLYRYA